jgi:hypothetical protein
MSLLALLIPALPAAADALAADDAYSVQQGTLLDVPAPGVLGNDCCPPITAVLSAAPAHGQLTLSADGSFTYQHDGGADTQDVFYYQVLDSDGFYSENFGAVVITISADPVPPPGGEDPPPGGEDPPPPQVVDATFTFTEVEAVSWGGFLPDDALHAWTVTASAAAPATVSSAGALPPTAGVLKLRPVTNGGSAVVREHLRECERMALLAQSRGDKYDFLVFLQFEDTAILSSEEEVAIDVSNAFLECLVELQPPG